MQVELFLNSVPLLSSLSREQKITLVDAFVEETFAGACGRAGARGVGVLGRQGPGCRARRAPLSGVLGSVGAESGLSGKWPTRPGDAAGSWGSWMRYRVPVGR